MNNLFKYASVRFFLGIVFALLLTLTAQHYLAVMNYYLIPCTAIYVMQTAIGNVFYHGMRRLLFVLGIAAIAAACISSLHFFYDIAHDLLMGASIGIFTNLVFFSQQPEQAFRKAVLATVKTYQAYFANIIDQLVGLENNKSTNIILENTLCHLPDWVYQRGFSQPLKTGYQFFLIKLEQISDVLFAMQHLVRYEYDKELIAKIRPALLGYADHVNEFFNAMMTVLEFKKLVKEPHDLLEEIEELQKQFFAIMPASLELLDMRRDYVYLAAFIYDLKDLRRFLVRLGEALR